MHVICWVELFILFMHACMHANAFLCLFKACLCLCSIHPWSELNWTAKWDPPPQVVWVHLCDNVHIRLRNCHSKSKLFCLFSPNQMWKWVRLNQISKARWIKAFQDVRFFQYCFLYRRWCNWYFLYLLPQDTLKPTFTVAGLPGGTSKNSLY